MQHAIIIGGGPAGSIASLLLARNGWRVTLIEQNRFPRDKVCGECVSATGADVLQRSNLFRHFEAAGAVPLTRAILHTDSTARAEEQLPRKMWGLSRRVMDGLLLNHAANAGANVLQPARAEAVTPDADGLSVRVRVRNLVVNKIDSLIGDIVIIADGKASLGAANSPAATGDFGIKNHFENVDGPRDAIELFATAKTYGGLAAIEGNRWNVAFSVPAEMLRKFRGDIEGLFAHRIVAGNGALSHRLRRAAPTGPWLAAPLPRFAVTDAWPSRVVLIGNAAAALEPIGGEGMGLAMRSAELAVQALTTSKGNWTADCASELRRSFRQLWNVRRLACRAAALAMSSPWADDLLPLAATSPRLMHGALRMIGK